MVAYFVQTNDSNIFAIVPKKKRRAKYSALTGKSKKEIRILKKFACLYVESRNDEVS